MKKDNWGVVNFKKKWTDI